MASFNVQLLMTITERNRKQYGLREQMAHYKRQAEWCAEEIERLNRVYRDQDSDLAKEMFNAN